MLNLCSRSGGNAQSKGQSDLGEIVGETGEHSLRIPLLPSVEESLQRSCLYMKGTRHVDLCFCNWPSNDVVQVRGMIFLLRLSAPLGVYAFIKG